MRGFGKTPSQPHVPSDQVGQESEKATEEVPGSPWAHGRGLWSEVIMSLRFLAVTAE